jgi:NADH-quinone oxidoreductase subunit I
MLGMLKSLGVTFVELLKPKYTVRYPEERLVLPPGYRGAPLLVLDEEKNRARCAGCGVCVRTCPQGVINIETKTRPDGSREVLSYQVEINRCLFCGLCEEACPFNAIKMSEWFELPAYARTALRYDKHFWNDALSEDVFVSQNQQYIDKKTKSKKTKVGAK